MLRKTSLGVLVAAALLTMGCRGNAQPQPEHQAEAAPRSQAAVTETQESVEKESTKTVTRSHKARYGRVSTEGNFILVKVGSEGQEPLTIVIDNSDWIYWFGEALNLPMEPKEKHEKYVEYMLAHENEVFMVPEKLYARAKNYAAPEPSAEMQALSNEQIQERYLQRERRSFTLKDPKMRRDVSFLRLLLERGCLVKTDCESGMMVISF